MQRVPQKFTNEHSNRLSENWILSLRNGYKIPVRYDSTNSTLVGVRDLLVDFGVMGGEVLVFEQVDKGNFKLYIIGVDGCEMKYPVIMHASQQTAAVEGIKSIQYTTYFVLVCDVLSVHFIYVYFGFSSKRQWRIDISEIC